ncbi:L-rhamnose mutarotase [Polaribacter sp.]|uniref:L-rhamnose mutarotase n=1 Tax=Polaribacter sp. TaxID=1920175 RepID=UPI0025FADEE0|nr:L-rhamnose mutarotase [Polaribacter sp.]
MSKISLKRHCLTLDLKEDKNVIKAYKKQHEKVWPEIEESLKASGIKSTEIYLTGNRLFMILQVDTSFSFEKKAILDANNPKVQEWETLMWNYQKALPFAKPKEKWVLIDKIYQLK